MPEDYDCPECFECGDECSTVDGKLVCDNCGKTYTQEEWDDIANKICEEWVGYMMELRLMEQEDTIG